jgi:large subunit ribosomal protein L4
LKLDGKKTLMALGSLNANIYKSSRNISSAKVVNASDLSTYDILNAENLILAESSVKVIETLLSK